MLKNITIKSRIIFVIAFLSFQLIVGGIIGIVSLGFANTSMKSLYEDRLVAMGQLDQVVRLLDENQLVIAKAITGDQTVLSQQIDEVNIATKKLDKVWGEFMTTNLTPEEKGLADEFALSRGKFIVDGINPAVVALRAQDIKLATNILHGPIAQLFLPVQNVINILIRKQLEIGRQKFKESQNTFNFVCIAYIFGTLFGLFLAIFVGIWLIRAISAPLKAAVNIARSVAAGDLTQGIDVRSTDEIGQLMQALKNMNDRLLKIVGEVLVGTDTIAAVSIQIASGNRDLSSRTAEQASSLEQTALSMEELTSTVKQNADNAHQANQLAASASEVAIMGGVVVSQVVNTMGSINESARKIVDIISMIDGIAFQTNILALNAAVEAARAGEQGRGFAVVATEVRNLAQRSTAAAKEIKSLISDSLEKVEAGRKLAGEAGNTMDNVVASVKRVTDIMGEITTATQEQSNGIAQVNQAISQMDQVTQQNAALVEQAAAAADNLQEQAEELVKMVSMFKLDETHIVVTSTPVLESVKTHPKVQYILSDLMPPAG
ncbi:MAG: methyl-accepting chemotaxis protein [Oxalobacteraceae bacterium]|nr:methyl-accepting chemotaxis protein [Oxalobacteraceae bacterium]